ncbi:MAG: helix-turn-helix domain containing protein [Lachnospiraceae bacterium]|nr:helix-turn-helix domain containing protein [Lachnospiraceae bacterium]
MLALKETFKTISKNKKVTQLEMAQTLGISKQNFSNKVQRNTFSPNELVKIADMLEMELAFVDKSASISNGNKYTIESADTTENK